MCERGFLVTLVKQVLSDYNLTFPHTPTQGRLLGG